jgi:hypothetical protein
MADDAHPVNLPDLPSWLLAISSLVTALCDLAIRVHCSLAHTWCSLSSPSFVAVVAMSLDSGISNRRSSTSSESQEDEQSRRQQYDQRITGTEEGREWPLLKTAKQQPQHIQPHSTTRPGSEQAAQERSAVGMVKGIEQLKHSSAADGDKEQ